MTVLAACRVRVPCTTSNLGAGFDCLGLAFDRYLEAAFEPGGSGLRLVRGGTLAELDRLDVPTDRDRLAVAFRSRLGLTEGGTLDGVLRVTSDIPVAKGLGSSAAATIAGLVLARAAAGVALAGPPAKGDAGARRSSRSIVPAHLASDPRAAAEEPSVARPASRFEPREVAAEAIAIEGHPDNVGPALLGGLVFAGWPPGATGGIGEPMLRRLPLSPEIGFAFAAPPAPVDTNAARAMLPSTVPFAVTTRSLPRVAALLYGLAHADAECLRAGFDDELHVPYRLPQIRGAATALAAAREAGAWAATISGSGSGLIAVCRSGREAGVAEAMCDALRRASGDAVGFPLQPELDGARVIPA